MTAVHPGRSTPPPRHVVEVVPTDGPTADLWDAFVASVPGADIVQSARWGRTKTRLGFEVLLLVLWRDGVIVGGAQLVLKRLPVFGAVAYVAAGPVVRPNDGEACGQVVTEMGHVARSLRLRTIVVQPPGDAWDVAAVLEAAGFEPSPIEIAPSATCLVDVRCTDEEILARMSSTRRRFVRRSTQQPIEVRTGASTLDDFAALHHSTSQRQGFTPRTSAYLAAQWDELAAAGNLEVFVAYAGGRPAAGIWVSAFGERAVFRHSGWGGNKDLHVNEACHWAAMHWAREHGCDWYDLGGFHRPYAELLAAGRQLPEDLPDRWSHLRFKATFGGRMVVAPPPRHGPAGGVVRAGARTLRTLDIPILDRAVERLRNG